MKSEFEKAIERAISSSTEKETIRLPERVVVSFVNSKETEQEVRHYLDCERVCLEDEQNVTIDVDWELKNILARRERMTKRYRMTIQLRGEKEFRRVWLFDKELTPGPSLKLRNHSPDGFNWGYGGSGPAQLALAICLELFGPDKACKVYQDFKWQHIATLPPTDFELDIQIDV